MKSELDYYRKFSLIDYSVNTKKFKEYLEFCRRAGLYQEKMDILEKLVLMTNEKSQSGAQNLNEILSNYTNLCVLVVINSDFEIENFFKISGFTLNFQKTVLYQAINYSLDRSKEQHDLVYNKYQFWVLKLMNKNISLTGDLSPLPPISNEELTQCLEFFEKKILDGSLNFNSQKNFWVKVTYELGYFYYLENNNEKAINYFSLCLKEFENLSNDIVLSSGNTIYFERQDVESLLKYLRNKSIELAEKEEFLQQDHEMENSENFDVLLNFNESTNLMEKDFQLFSSKISIDPVDKIIYEQFSVDDSNIIKYIQGEELIKYSKNMIMLAFKNYSKLQECKKFLEKTSEVLKNKIPMSQLSENALRDYNITKKENFYHEILLTLIQSVYNNEIKLAKKFLSSLSGNIITYTLTDDLQINGMIHGLIINFTQSFKHVKIYFDDFVEFFKQATNNNQKETVNLIYFLSLYLNIVNTILFSENKPKTVKIEGDLHLNLFNMIFFWLGNMQENITDTNDNILFILIETVKNSNFLIILKIIYSEVLSFLYEKRGLVKSEEDIFDSICAINPIFYKLETIMYENKTNPVFSNLQIIFKPEFQKKYDFTALQINYFEDVLLKLLKKIEKKIRTFGKFTELQIIERRNNILFFEFVKRKNSQINLISNSQFSNNEIVIEYIKYYKIIFENFKLKFYKEDMFIELTSINSYYSEFKSKLDEVILLRFVYILSSLNKSIEASIILQYKSKLDYDLVYKLLNKNLELHNSESLQYIWKITYFEYLANIYYTLNRIDDLSIVTNLIKRTSNHQFFKGHALRKLFKILNFFKFIENLNI